MIKRPVQRYKFLRPAAPLPAAYASKHGHNIIHHRHTGHRIPLKYTSYAVLFFLLALTGALLLFAGQAARADQQQQQGSINLGGMVQGPPPSQAPLIVQPVNNSHVTSNIIDVKGLCEAGLVVEVYRNGAFSGSVFCNSDGNFKLTITLIPGSNQLHARQGDSFGRYSPDSATTTVFYDVPTSVQQRSAGAGGVTARPLLIYTTPVQWGVSPGNTLKLDYQINGGLPAYAVTIDWQDKSRNDLYSHEDEGDFSATHRYNQPGQYTVTIFASDKLGNHALIQTTIIVNGKGTTAATIDPCAQPAAATTLECYFPNRITAFLDRVWPALIVATLMAASFWVGERVVLARPPKRSTGPAR